MAATGIFVLTGTVAAQNAGAGMQIDPRPYAEGSIAEVFRAYPHLGNVLPAMGYSDEQLHELEQTINRADCDVVISGTPIDLGRLITSRHPIRHARYELRELPPPLLDEVLAPLIERVRATSYALTS